MLRLFTGISIPADISARLRLLGGGIAGAAWSVPENYHITLAFIGEVDDAVAERVHLALSTVRAPSFPLSLKGMGVFERGDHPHTLFAAVEPAPELLALKARTDAALEKEGLPFEHRKYTPHLTLARLKAPDPAGLGRFLASNSLLTAGPFVVADFVLYRSHATKNGYFYEPLERYPLT